MRGEIFGKKTNAITLRLFDLLLENKRLPLLPLVAKEYSIIYDVLQGVENAHVTTAIPLTKELEASGISIHYEANVDLIPKNVDLVIYM